MQYAECKAHGRTIPVSDDGLHEGVCPKCEAEADTDAMLPLPNIPGETIGSYQKRLDGHRFPLTQEELDSGASWDFGDQ